MNFKHIYFDDTKRLKWLIRSIGKYNKRAYKQIVLKDRFVELEFKPINDELYEAELITDSLFEKVYGKCKIIAEIRNEQIKVLYLEPEDLLRDGYMKMLDTYKGVPFRNKQDLFKIKLAERMNKWYLKRFI